MKIHVLILLMLGACSRQADAPASDQTNAATPAPSAQAADPAAKAFAFDENNDLIEFHFGWSAEAAAIPQLVERFRRDMAKAKGELLATAKADQAERAKYGDEFRGYMSSTSYETAGQSDRLLSLRADIGSYTGGAHGNSGTRAVLWDRKTAREIGTAELFTAADNLDRVLTQRWCDALNKARQEKREGEDVGGMFNECPKLGEITILPTDKDKDGRFERLVLVADPYVAGPYSEGSYEVDLGVTPELLAALKAEYRPSFEVQTQ